jgi:hypothetical protein
MSSASARPRWFFLITPRWLGWHAFAVLATIGMLWLGDWQYHRALAGNALSWAYTFEWPIFAVMGVLFWGRTIRDEFRHPGGSNDAEAEEPDLPAGAAAGGAGTPARLRSLGVTAEAAGDDEEDPDLAAYNAYLARLNQQVKGHGRWHGLR